MCSGMGIHSPHTQPPPAEAFAVTTPPTFAELAGAADASRRASSVAVTLSE